MGPSSAVERPSRGRFAPSRGNSAGGFTLLEALIIVGVLGILAAATGAALQQLIPRWRLQEAGNQLDSVIKRARLVAVQRHRTVEIRFENDAGIAVPLAGMQRGVIYTLVANDGSEDVARAPLNALGVGVEVDANTFAGEVIRFDELGRSNGTGTITFGYSLGAGRRQLAVAIETTTGITTIEETVT